MIPQQSALTAAAAATAAAATAAAAFVLIIRPPLPQNPLKSFISVLSFEPWLELISLPFGGLLR